MKTELKAEHTGSDINSATIYFEILRIDSHAVPLVFTTREDRSDDLMI